MDHRRWAAAYPEPAAGAEVALWASTAAFTACFAVWTIFSIIGLSIKDELGLSEAEFGLLIGTPILTGRFRDSFSGSGRISSGGEGSSLS